MITTKKIKNINKISKAGIYIHIPFCLQKCNYCAFLSGKASEEERENYVQLLCKEIELRSDKSRVCDTVFFGGGTPSLLSNKQIDKVLKTAFKYFNIEDNAEITMEANPATLTFESLRGYKSAGVNRLSMGVESMHDEILKKLGRVHNSEQVINDFGLARASGFNNINLDLMFAVPGSTVESILEDIEKVTALEPEHISFYSLQLEEGTKFFRDFEAGKFEEIPDEIDRIMYHEGLKMLKNKGYEHYEISNFCKSGKQSKHNLKYWNMDDYYGFGLGSSSFVKGVRSTNKTEMNKYIHAVLMGKAPYDSIYKNTESDSVSEAVFTGLRKQEGFRYKDILGSYESFWNYYKDVYDDAEAFSLAGYLLIDKEGIRLTEYGIDISNKIMALFV